MVWFLPRAGAGAQASLGITFDVDVGTLRKLRNTWRSSAEVGINGEHRNIKLASKRTLTYPNIPESMFQGHVGRYNFINPLYSGRFQAFCVVETRVVQVVVFVYLESFTCSTTVWKMAMEDLRVPKMQLLSLAPLFKDPGKQLLLLISINFYP